MVVGLNRRIYRSDCVIQYPYRSERKSSDLLSIVLKVTWNAFKSLFLTYSVAISVINNEFVIHVNKSFYRSLSNLICGYLLLQIFKTAVTYFAAWWRQWRQWHCCVSLFAYYYEVKSRDRTTNIRTLAHSHAHLQKTQWLISPGQCKSWKRWI
jgi:hypothetical protein